MTTQSVLETADAYHRAWVARDVETMLRLLAPNLVIDVPLITYPTREAFVSAVAAFSALTRRVTMLDAFANAKTALHLYDMDVEGLGVLRVAEHFTVASNMITHIRHVHDTHAIRAAGFAGT